MSNQGEVKQKPKEFVQLEMNYLGLVVLHLCVFLLIYLDFESNERWVAGIQAGENVVLSLGLVGLAFLIALMARKSFLARLRELKLEENEDYKLREYVKIAFQRYLVSTLSAIILIASMYWLEDPFFAIMYALLLVYLTSLRPDFVRMQYATGIKQRPIRKTEEKERKRRV